MVCFCSRFETMSWFSPFLYAPFYVFAIYAFIFEKEWIRIPGKQVGSYCGQSCCEVKSNALFCFCCSPVMELEPAA